jgi:hypothetical protein
MASPGIFRPFSTEVVARRYDGAVLLHETMSIIVHLWPILKSIYRAWSIISKVKAQLDRKG